MSCIGKILVIEDNDGMVETITLALQIRWPEVCVIATGTGKEGVELVKKEKPEVVILDLGLPDINGFEVLKRLRRFCDTPVIILTVRRDEEDIVKGLELGANDYIVKPFRQMELLSRVNVHLRKNIGTLEKLPLSCGRLHLDLNSQVLHFNNNRINLTPIESKLMKAFMKNAGIILSHATLARAVWGDYYQGASYCLKVHIRRLREKIEVDPSNPDIILTKSHIGYYLAKPD